MDRNVQGEGTWNEWLSSITEHSNVGVNLMILTKPWERERWGNCTGVRDFGLNGSLSSLNKAVWEWIQWSHDARERVAEMSRWQTGNWWPLLVDREKNRESTGWGTWNEWLSSITEHSNVGVNPMILQNLEREEGGIVQGEGLGMNGSLLSMNIAVWEWILWSYDARERVAEMSGWRTGNWRLSSITEHCSVGVNPMILWL